MQFRFFAIPALDAAGAEEELNRFLRSHRILAVDRRLVEGADAPLWALCVQYLDRVAGTAGGEVRLREKVDFREVLNQADFAVFSKLRELRKAIAEKEGLPPYALFTNEQLAAMVTRKAVTLAAIGQIEGVGAARLEKYGEAFLKVLQTVSGHTLSTPETGGAS